MAGPGWARLCRARHGRARPGKAIDEEAASVEAASSCVPTVTAISYNQGRGISVAQEANSGVQGGVGGGFGYYGDDPRLVDPRKKRLLTRLKEAVAVFRGRHVGLPLPPQGVGGEAKLTTSDTGAGDASYTSFADRHWQAYYDRRPVYFDLREMDYSDPVVHRALDVIADCVTGFEDSDVDGFEWSMETQNEAALQVLTDLKKRLRLGSEVWQVVRKFVLFGEEFREIVVNDQLDIVRFKSLPAYQVMPNFDEWGNKIGGWTQRPEVTATLRTVEFDEWQVIPFIAGARRGYFGTGLMMASRRSWRRLQKMADGMAIARMTRAYDKFLHRVPVKAEWDLKRQQEVILRYKDNMTKRRGLDASGNVTVNDDRNSVGTDFFIADDGTRRGGIDILASQNMQLMNVEDLNYHLNELLCALIVPRKYLGFPGAKGAMGDASLTAEDVQFARSLRSYQAVLREGLELLAQWALLFKGFDSQSLGVGVNLALISTHDHLQNAKIQFTMAQAASLFAQTLLGGGLPWELVAAKYMDLSDDEKAIMATFIKSEEFKEAKVIAPPGVSAPGSPTPKTSTKPEDDEDADQGVPAEAVAQTLTKLSMLCQREAERHGVKFTVGHDERLARTRAVIAEIWSAGANGHDHALR